MHILITACDFGSAWTCGTSALCVSESVSTISTGPMHPKSSVGCQNY